MTILWAALLIFLSAAAFFVYQKEKKLFSLKSVFNEGQYFFSRQTNERGVFGPTTANGIFLEGFGPPFLISGKVLASLDLPNKRTGIEQYIVEKGDTINSIAKKFGISVQTILSANNLSSRSLISPGKKLVILPVSGVLHVVNPGDTLSKLSHLYKVSIAKIIEANNLSASGKIYVGDFLVIPGAKKPKTSLRYAKIPLSHSYFICPIPSPCRVTQGLHWFNAIDFSNGRCGEPVFAAAAGVIQKVNYNSRAGNYIRILHPNGAITFYGHLSRIAVYPGQKISQGDIIGYIGHTGHTIPAGPRGCHLHFEVRFAENPFAAYHAGAKISQ